MINKIKISFLSFLFFCNITTYSQAIKTKEDLKNLRLYSSTLKTSPFAIIAGPIILTSEYRLAFETVMADNQSLQLGLSYLGKSWYTSLLERADSLIQPQDRLFIVGVRVQLTYKIFLTSFDAPEGLYIAPHFSYSYCKFSTKYYNNVSQYIRAIYVNYNGIIGYQFIYNKIAVEAFCGLGYRDNTWIEYNRQNNTILDNEELEFYHGHLKIIFGINAGYAF